MLILVFYTFKDIVHDYGRSLLTTASLAIVVVSYLLLASLSQAYLSFGKQTLVTQNLIIISADAVDPMESSLDAGVLQIVQQIAPAQIKQTFPAIFRHMDIQGHIMQVRAVPLEDMQQYNNLELLQGQWPQNESQVVISEGVTQITPWKVGTGVNIYGSEFQITGIVRAGGNKFASIWMTYPAGLQLFGDLHGFQMGFLVIAPNNDPEMVRAKLQADPRLGQQNVVFLENTVSDRYNQLNDNLLTLSLIQVVISLLAITFGTYNSTCLSLIERSIEINLLRVIGFTQNKVRMILFSRTFMQTILAYLIGWIISDVIIVYQRTHNPINIHASPLVLSMGIIPTILGLALSISFALLGVVISTKE